jgi:hypothetical protein
MSRLLFLGLPRMSPDVATEAVALQPSVFGAEEFDGLATD